MPTHHSPLRACKVDVLLHPADNGVGVGRARDGCTAGPHASVNQSKRCPSKQPKRVWYLGSFAFTKSSRAPSNTLFVRVAEHATTETQLVSPILEDGTDLVYAIAYAVGGEPAVGQFHDALVGHAEP